MKKRFVALFIVLALIVPAGVFAGSADYEDLLKTAADIYEDKICSAAEAIEADGDAPDVDKAEVLLWVEPGSVKGNSFSQTQGFLFVFIPDKNNDDIHCVSFNSKGIDGKGKNLDFGGRLSSLYSDEAKEAVSVVTNAEAVINLNTGSRVGFLAYYVIGKDANYILVYAEHSDSLYNAVEQEEFEIEFGKPYEEKEFLELLGKEELAYREYVKKQNEERRANVIYKDENGDVWQNVPKDEVHTDDDRDDNEDDRSTDRKEKPGSKGEDAPKEESDNSATTVDSSKDDPEPLKSEVPEKKSRQSKIKAVNNYGVFVGDENGNLKESSAITRAEFAAVLCRMLGLETAAEAGSMDFEDVGEGHWAKGYINAARKAGIIAGRGENKFDPDAGISYEEAQKMLVAAMGYTPKAEQKGGYPFGYTDVARELGLTDDLIIMDKKEAVRGDIMEMVYNSLDIPMMLQKGYDSKEEYEIADGKNGNTKRTIRIILEETGN